MLSYEKIDVVWISANKFGYSLLKEALKINSIKIKAIITLKENAKTKMYDAINRIKWYEFGIPVYEIEDINKEEKLLKKLSPKLIIVCGWRQIIKEHILEIPKKGVVGFHPSLLPKNRGPAPIINTILEGLHESGVTMFYLGKKVDGGDIIGQKRFLVGENDYAEDVYRKVIRAGRYLISKYLPLLAEGNAPRTPQKEEEATYFSKRSLKDNEIRIGVESPQQIYRKIRAFSKPYLGAYIRLGNKKLIIWRAELKDGNDK